MDGVTGVDPPRLPRGHPDSVGPQLYERGVAA